MPTQRVELFHEIDDIVEMKRVISLIINKGNLIVSVIHNNGTLLVVYFEGEHLEQL